MLCVFSKVGFSDIQIFSTYHSTRKHTDDNGPISREALAAQQKYSGATCSANVSYRSVNI